jgi:PAS domain S-box-containing protein
LYFFFYQVFMVFSLIISLFLIALVWRRRKLMAAPAMIALLIAVFIWTFGFYLESHSHTLGLQLFFNNIGYLGSMSVPIAWFVFALNYSADQKRIVGRKTILFCILPLIFTAFIWTNGWHHLIWSNQHLVTSGAFTVTEKTYEPLFWVMLVHNYIYIAVGGFFLFRRIFVGTRLFAGQAFSLIVGVCLPWIWNAIYVFNLVAIPRKDLTPVMFAISGIALVMGLLRFRLFTIIPFANRFVIRQVSDAVLVFNAYNLLVEANPAALRLLGVDETIMGKTIEEFRSVSPALQTVSPSAFGQRDITLTVAGEQRFFELEISPMHNDFKQQVGWLAFFHDVTARKQAEDQYKLITENTADVIYKLTIRDETYTYVSPSAERMFGYTEKEALTKKPADILTPASYERQRFEFLKDMEGGIPHRTLQLEAIHKDGHVFPIEVHTSLVRNGKGEPDAVIGVVRDITERKKMEQQLLMQDRLAAIGQLTAGVAHELNNPLTSVISFSSLLMNRDLPEDVMQDLKIINDEAQRTAMIVKTLLTFARKQAQEKQKLDVNDTIRKVLELRAYEQKVNNIHVVTQYTPDIPPVLGNIPQLQQVFFNVIINAEFFMIRDKRKGTLTITTETVNNAVRISFADNGPGITPEDMKYVFTPFFSTKRAGEGTGLSMSICLGIITEHSGRIWAESAPGSGATFIIELPIYYPPA